MILGGSKENDSYQKEFKKFQTVLKKKQEKGPQKNVKNSMPERISGKEHRACSAAAFTYMNYKYKGHGNKVRCKRKTGR